MEAVPQYRHYLQVLGPLSRTYTTCPSLPSVTVIKDTMKKLGFSCILHKYYGAIMTRPMIKSQAKILA